MKAQDWMDQDNNRSRAISHLAELCAELGLNWSAGEHKLIITLPIVQDTSVRPTIPGRLRKTFDISRWGEKGIDETEFHEENIKVNDDGTISPIDSSKPSNYNTSLPDDFQMPDTGEILDEGEPPVGDKDAEK